MAAILSELARELRRFRGAMGERDGGDNFAVVGGLAVSVWTEPRFTRDADFAVVAADDAAAEAVVLFLQVCGYRVLHVFEHASGRMSTVRLIPPGGNADGVLVDLLFASSGIEAEADIADARAAVALITERGFNRGRDLVGALIALIAANSR